MKCKEEIQESSLDQDVIMLKNYTGSVMLEVFNKKIPMLTKYDNDEYLMYQECLNDTDKNTSFDPALVLNISIGTKITTIENLINDI